MSALSRASWRRWLARLGPRDRSELVVLLGAVGMLVLLLAFFILAAEVFEGDTQSFDNRVLTALRRSDNPSVPVGPVWLRAGALDITALGSPTVLGLATLAVCGFLLLQGMTRTATFVFAATTGGWILNEALKVIFQRARPAVVPHLQTVLTLSFPSGHAMNSAAVYLTLGALTMRVAEGRLTKLYCMATAMFVTFLVGTSRIFLGVHYPTDVLAGWLLGMTWALACWTVERRIEHRAGLRRERRSASTPGGAVPPTV
jgi:undecaprenyl-diphosphatase